MIPPRSKGPIASILSGDAFRGAVVGARGKEMSRAPRNGIGRGATHYDLSECAGSSCGLLISVLTNSNRQRIRITVDHTLVESLRVTIAEVVLLAPSIFGLIAQLARQNLQ
jgi:hypothetical protein